MDYKTRAYFISLGTLLIGVSLSGMLFFLHWVFDKRLNLGEWLLWLSYAVFIGSALIAFILQIGSRYNLPRMRVAGFLLIIIWIAAALISTVLDSITLLSTNMVQGISYTIVIGGFFVLVVPGFLLMIFPWPPRFLIPKTTDTPKN
ncbi:hypothetical protein ACFLYO_10000 [Chloroflexota bacterium]